jgi:hypothetical protein
MSSKRSTRPLLHCIADETGHLVLDLYGGSRQMAVFGFAA